METEKKFILIVIIEQQFGMHSGGMLRIMRTVIRGLLSLSCDQRASATHNNTLHDNNASTMKAQNKFFNTLFQTTFKIFLNVFLEADLRRRKALVLVS